MNGFDEFISGIVPNAEKVYRDATGASLIFRVGKRVVLGTNITATNARFGIIDSFRDTGMYIKFDDGIVEPRHPDEVRIISEEIYDRIVRLSKRFKNV